MNQQAHLVIGFLLFLGYGYTAGLSPAESGEFLVPGILAATAGSLWPDILEPPAGPKHRGICHSRRALKLAAVLFLFTAMPVLVMAGIPSHPAVFGVSCFFLGYAGHLLADSVTRAGLPA